MWYGNSMKNLINVIRQRYNRWNTLRKMRNSVDQVWNASVLLMEIIHDRRSNYIVSEKSKKELTNILDDLHGMNSKLRQRLRDELTK